MLDRRRHRRVNTKSPASGRGHRCGKLLDTLNLAVRRVFFLIGSFGLATAAVVAAQAPVPPPAAPYRAMLDQYCVTCHNQRLKTGGLTLDGNDLGDVGSHAETW